MCLMAGSLHFSSSTARTFGVSGTSQADLHTTLSSLTTRFLSTELLHVIRKGLHSSGHRKTVKASCREGRDDREESERDAVVHVSENAAIVQAEVGCNLGLAVSSCAQALRTQAWRAKSG